MWIRRDEFNRLAAEVNRLAKIICNYESITNYVKDKKEFIMLGNDVAITSPNFIRNVLIKEKQNKDKAGCIVVCTNDKEEFEKAINNNLEQGYKIISSSCNTKEFKAIMCDKRFSE